MAKIRKMQPALDFPLFTGSEPAVVQNLQFSIHSKFNQIWSSKKRFTTSAGAEVVTEALANLEQNFVLQIYNLLFNNIKNSNKKRRQVLNFINNCRNLFGVSFVHAKGNKQIVFL